MKKTILENNVSIVATKKEKTCKLLDYYLCFPSGRREYAFTRKFSHKCFNICKSPIPVNNLLKIHCGDRALMSMEKYLRFMLPYLVDYYDLTTVEKCNIRRKAG